MPPAPALGLALAHHGFPSYNLLNDLLTCD